ncbi:MAG: sigma 54-interacting transcriptional regulator [Candidatus Latescibacteria bacterium]|nr:sigma 54-interacting transcriptional regulator [Candidatus Latescibacterota bacterium]
MESFKQGNNRVLIVDDQPEIHDDFAEMLRSNFANPSDEDLVAAFVHEQEGDYLPEFELLHANNGEEACEIIRGGRNSNRPVAVAYIDIRMPPGIDGIETVRRVREFDRDIEIVIMTAYTDRSLPEIVYDMELLHKLLYIRKPFTHEEIQQITLSLVGKWNVEQELAEQRRQLAVSHGRLKAVLNATGDAIAMHDVTGRLVFANEMYINLLGLKGIEQEKLPPPDLAARFEERFRKPDLSHMVGGPLPDGGQLVETTGAGGLPEQRQFYRLTAPVCDEQGQPIGNLILYRDVSGEIDAEQMKAEVLRLRTELETTYSFEGMVGTSPEMQRVYALMNQAAKSEITVLIRGESGTGKELVARSFHFNSSRKKGQFIALDCATIPETLIESELFGHEKGAFTGAATRRIGAFERAHKGTILIDEIGDLPYALQGKLLRVLQEREIQRIGGKAPISVDIRVIVATNKDLEHAVRKGVFREDLFYRVAAFPIAIPPLRERREDIPLLAEHFIGKYAERMKKTISGISTAAMRLLLQYEWPGNVRELENAIERAVLLATEPVIQAGNLPPQMSPAIASGSKSALAATVLPLAEVERQALLLALEAAGDNITRAARALGIHRATLHRKLKKYNEDTD